MSKTLLSGPKFNNTHQTFIPGAKETIQALKDHPNIKKILLGEISPASAGKARCKLRSIEGNLITLMYRSVSSVQVIRAVATDIEAVKALIEELTADSTKQAKKKTKHKGAPVQGGIQHNFYGGIKYEKYRGDYDPSEK